MNATTTRERPAPPPAVPSAASVAALTAHPLRAELLRGFAPWAGAAVVCTLLANMAAKSDQWQGSWGETQSSLHIVSALLGGPLAAAAGCWQGGRERRRRTAELRATAARGPLAQFLVASLPLAVWVVAGYAVTAVATLLATWPYVSAGRPVLSALPADAAFLAAMALVGQVVGRLVAWRLAAPVLALCAYLVLGIPSYQTSGARHLSPASADSMGISLPVWWQPLATTAWTGGLAAAAVLAYAARRRYTALLPLAAATVAGVLVAQTGDAMWRADPLANQQVCNTSVTPGICVNALYKGLLPKVSDALSGVTGRLEGVENLPVRFHDLPRESHPDEVRLPMLDPLGQSVVRGELTDPEQYAWEAAAALTGRADRCEARLTDPRAYRVDDAVTEWLGPGPLRDDMDRLSEEWARGQGADKELAGVAADRRALARLKSMGGEERRAWLSRYFATVGSCDPGKVPAL
ncbi:hypothetical protein OG883_05335 [Streptomyces sp. NBC_01142]|uniref:hypothetical protein n=1 Tax=Streptomyces sp. NBC_01142 TaxID=2975865 RepID=UPI0022560024|nr:hypothetical protein [Streptomyces sp. NBC_01142]MCX4819336.1 hypothetical protein [Streptomyces sp. NBC_01142]